MRILRGVLLSLGLGLPLSIFAACGTTTTGGTDAGVTADMAKGKVTDMALLSQCGKPGDVGNNLGVGKFCMLLSDCDGKAGLCSSLGNGPDPAASDTYFCTILCKSDGGVDCGDNATCTCGDANGMGGCACTPNSCLGN